MAEGNSVSYTTKELINQINEKLDRMLISLEHKAEKSTTEALLQGQTSNRDRITQLEFAKNQYVPIVDKHEKRLVALESWRTRFVGLIAVFGPLATISFGVILDHFVIR